ncbi:RmlC-like cupin domain-containing protein [Colletotrichum godetiae]|uniref:homogentisate 1,2-dioxygenase n=1 Tax=Colletotrichum godetiae TaxID=1209918 RepID=A0AAJ0AEC2_9PEZI|nr:RmlC-like cupin domain-containing protein [Colletotrichum godetiae]KAK1671750.1 RmlC-like cupin domain-containing protein [Colletotrichum godetiae]
MYRIWPSVAHRDVVPPPELNPWLQACFSPFNERVKYVAAQQAWDPFPLPGEDGDAGSGGLDFGDPISKEGIAIYVYTASRPMTNRAFCNNEADFMILPQQGRLDIQTELGWLTVRPGEDYIQEIFGSHYELPELEPLESNRMALSQDFQSLVASFDIDSSEREIVYKMADSHLAAPAHSTPWRGRLP